LTSSDEDEQDHKEQSHKRPKPPKVKILRSLSDLAIYTASTHYHSFSNPLSKLFNHIHSFSERAFKKLLENSPDALREHNSNYLIRVYPYGLRVSSSNQEPAVFWRNGAQLVALNWQKFDLGMMQNEALFNGSGGMVLKPEYIQPGNAKAVYLTVDVIPHCV
jgi:Phosphatidylinositol-specific phospholipase C, Y domain